MHVENVSHKTRTLTSYLSVDVFFMFLVSTDFTGGFQLEIFAQF